MESAATLLTGVSDAASIAIAEAEDKLKRRKEIGDTLTMLVMALRNLRSYDAAPNRFAKGRRFP